MPKFKAPEEERSMILGHPDDMDVDLEREGRALCAVIRNICASLLDQKLARSSIVGCRRRA